MNPVANKIVERLSENKIKRTTILDRLKNAIRAFLAKPIQSISLGIDIKRCEKTVEQYIRCHDVNFDEYIETALIDEYGVQSPHELYEVYKREWCESRGYDPEAMDESVGINGECYACFDEWYVNEYAELKEV